MPSLKDLRNRIRSVRSTQKITKAMQMVAASKLRRAQEAVEAARPYASRLERMLASVSGGLPGEGGPPLLVGTGKQETYLLVVATADRGLAGAFSSSIVRKARQRIAELRRAGKTVKILCIGRKSRTLLRRDHGALIVDTVELSQMGALKFEDAAAVSLRVLDMYENGEFDVGYLYYSRFRSVISQIPTERQIIPVALPEPGEGEAAAEDLAGAVFEFEPDEEEILADLLPRNVSVQIFHALLENAASEWGARMSAMDNATRNAGDMIDRLTLNYNRTRQAVITKELIEIISGAEAL